MKDLDEFAALKALDPATRDPDPHSPRAQASLGRILATDLSYGGRPQRYRRPVVRAVVAVAAVGIAAAVVLLPREGGPLPNGDAYAGWTAQPSGMSAQEHAKAIAECRKSLKGAGTSNSQLAQTDAAMAERRGDWALVILTGPDQFEATCMTNVKSGPHGGGFGSVGGPGRPPVGPRELSVSGMGAGGGGSMGYVTTAMGRSGSDIVAMTYTSPTRGIVRATVMNGYFAFWVPGYEFEGTQPVPVRVTYRDGKTVATTLKLG
ncbi:hypothetical protein ACFVWG_36530 [Kribbella sp. NPDC058245]|uniref:hypothetical protein n=1 Tax=Kribbella sp. NPDC058245 TaxID=3346399 RepID=UPI0036ED42A1